MTDLINTNHWRISFINLRKHWDAPWFLMCHYLSADHAKLRHEHTWSIALFGRQLSLKWRPDGKQP